MWFIPSVSNSVRVSTSGNREILSHGEGDSLSRFVGVFVQALSPSSSPSTRLLYGMLDLHRSLYHGVDAHMAHAPGRPYVCGFPDVAFLSCNSSTSGLLASGGSYSHPPTGRTVNTLRRVPRAMLCRCAACCCNGSILLSGLKHRRQRRPAMSKMGPSSLG